MIRFYPVQLQHWINVNLSQFDYLLKPYVLVRVKQNSIKSEKYNNLVNVPSSTTATSVQSQVDRHYVWSRLSVGRSKKFYSGKLKLKKNILAVRETYFSRHKGGSIESLP